MKKILLLILAVTSTTCFSLPTRDFPQEKQVFNKRMSVLEEITSTVSTEREYSLGPLNEIKDMLHKEAPSLNSAVIDKVFTSLSCAKKSHTEHNNILTVIDYSLPSSEKRLWIFDLKEKKLLFHTYVSHGIKSGPSLSNRFSNKHDSKATSIGVYKTEHPYYGRDGLSLRLEGLDRGFNDNAFNRYIVMHGGWYVDEPFIKKYGRAGRSWGCPAIPQELTSPIINTIKEQSLFVAYYPSDNWFLKSKFLNCDNLSPIRYADKLETDGQMVLEDEPREDILFADINKNNSREENEPIVVMAADNYERILHNKAPLERMLRRQINHAEYIALSNTEFNQLIGSNDTLLKQNKEAIDAIYFVIPVIKMVRGYYETQMQIVGLGKIKKAKLNPEPVKSYTVQCEAKSQITLRTTNRFIRWLGL